MRRLSTADAGFAEAFRSLLLDRDTTAAVDGAVTEIIAAVRARGDAALCEYAAAFDRQALTPETLRIPADEIAQASADIAPDLAAALDMAAQRIEAFHRAQMPSDLRMQDAAGVVLGLRWSPLDAVGLYG